jgi:GDP-L-fucose synthase
MTHSRILVTGAGGLVGSQITGNVVHITSPTGDLRNKKTTEDIINFYADKERMGEYAVDSIIHCAGKVGGLGGNMKYKGEYLYDNVMINTNVIEAARMAGVSKLIAFLSTCIFPDKVNYPLTEDQIHNGFPHSSNYPYAYAKRLADIQIRAYREQYGLKYTSVVPTNIYGPNDNFSLEHGHVVPMLLHKMYLAMQTGEDFKVWGTGKPLREFIYSKDVAELAKWAVENYDEEEPILFTTSEEISIKDLVGIIAEEFNYKGNIVFEKDKPDGQFRKPSSNAKLMSYLPDFKFTPIEQGIRETVKWFIENYDNARK